MNSTPPDAVARVTASWADMVAAGQLSANDAAAASCYLDLSAAIGEPLALAWAEEIGAAGLVDRGVRYLDMVRQRNARAVDALHLGVGEEGNPSTVAEWLADVEDSNAGQRTLAVLLRFFLARLAEAEADGLRLDLDALPPLDLYDGILLGELDSPAQQVYKTEPLGAILQRWRDHVAEYLPHQPNGDAA